MQELDIAVFDLDPKGVERAVLEPVGVDRICDAVSGNSFKSRLFGYPGQFLKSRGGILGFHGLSYGCEPIEPSRWPAITKNRTNLNPDTNVVVQYGRDAVDFGPELGVPKGVPDPVGMSGGGLWQRPSPAQDGQLWTAEDLCLFAIQSYWLPSVDYLVAIQIIHWLKLVADTYPDLAPELIDRFPRLKQLN